MVGQLFTAILVLALFLGIYLFPHFLESETYRKSRARRLISRMMAAMHPEDKAVHQAWSVQHILRKPGLTPEDRMSQIEAVFVVE